MQTVLITGGTGLIGTALTRLLVNKGYRVIILSRGRKKKPDNPLVEYTIWDIRRGTIDKNAIGRADYIIHLAGAGVADKRWSSGRKKEIQESRVRAGELLVKTLREIPHQVKVVVSASAIGWYGPDPQIPNPRPFVETDPSYSDFLGATCQKWEQSTEVLRDMNIRLVRLRTGLVLSRDGGAFPEFKRPVHFGIAPILSKGLQMMSWIHIDDLCNMYLEAIERESLEGVYNAVAPYPISNKEFTLHLAKAIKGNFYIPLYVPAFIIKAMLGEMSIEVLKSTTVSAHKIRKTGFNFIYPTAEAAIGGLLSAGNQSGSTGKA